MQPSNRASLLSLFSPAVLGVIGVLLLQGCTYGPMQAPTQTGLVLYAKGARQHTATVQLELPPAQVYAAMQRVIRKRSDLQLLNSNEKRYLIEVMQGDKAVTAQATPLDGNSTLLFVWTDAGKSGDTGRDLALRSVNELCLELRVKCQMRDQ
jgi:hypothetical protein